MERLSGDFIRGYTKALMDVSELLATVVDDLKRNHRRLDGKQQQDFIRILTQHRGELREATGGFIRFNAQRKELEWYEPPED